MMIDNKPAFCKGATNVYRTKYYIVKQVLGVKCENIEDNAVFSHDVYYTRTLKRDIEYTLFFKDRRNIDGKRLPTTMYARRYVR